MHWRILMPVLLQKKKPKIIENSTIPDFIICVEATRFERATSASRTQRSTKLSHASIFRLGTKKATDGIRTRGLHLGKVALYQLSYYRIYYFLPSDDLL